ncbi:UNVERIFIED_CONTAM: putative methyltransferase [Brevibacillus sp. OAP136]
MKHGIETASANVRLEEGVRVIEQFLLACYFKPGISTKELARCLFLPVPVAAAIKKELIKAGALRQADGVFCTPRGKGWIEDDWGYQGLDVRAYRELLDNELETTLLYREVFPELSDLLQTRPQVDVQIDQSHCTPQTSLRRAVLCLRQHSLIGKKILCIGDDDLVSISIGLLLKRLFPADNHGKTHIDVVDLDLRYLDHISQIASERALPITCHIHDLRKPLPAKLLGRFDCFFTDPPYTLQGMGLFVSRGISALKKQSGHPIFLSFAHKSPAFMLAMQREFVQMGLVVTATLPGFNEYVGAEMIANRSQMLILQTTERTGPAYMDAFTNALYTGEVKRTMRTYRCKRCSRTQQVGVHCDHATIEALKKQGCPVCGSRVFLLVEKTEIASKAGNK